MRWKPTETIYRLLHPDFGIWFAHKVSKYSREPIENPEPFDLSSYREYAERKLDEGYNYVVMGHIHEAEIFVHQNGGFYVIGDWIGRQSYGVFENSELLLKFFNP